MEEPMTVKDLKKILNNFPDHLPVVNVNDELVTDVDTDEIELIQCMEYTSVRVVRIN